MHLSPNQFLIYPFLIKKITCRERVPTFVPTTNNSGLIFVSKPFFVRHVMAGGEGPRVLGLRDYFLSFHTDLKFGLW